MSSFVSSSSFIGAGLDASVPRIKTLDTIVITTRNFTPIERASSLENVAKCERAHKVHTVVVPRVPTPRPMGTRARRAVAPPRATRARARARRATRCIPRAGRDADRRRDVWLDTDSLECVAVASERNLTHTLIARDDARAMMFSRACAVDVLRVDGSTGEVVDANGEARGEMMRISTPEDCAGASARAREARGVVVMEAVDGAWSVIPAENLVAAFAGNEDGTLLASVGDAAEARVMLEALETGVDGVVLRTNDPNEVRALDAMMREHFGGECAEKISLVGARVTGVSRVGAGDRCAVDACVNFSPGEGMLVGSFASGLFLVHAENVECGYVNTRPFRVNAGPTASYCRAPGGKTNYLSELRAGSEILVVDSSGRARVANVARVKMERRSLVMIEAEHPDVPGTLAVLLQNAETCRLVRPNGEHVSVSELVAGDEVLVALDRVARHTGVAVDEDAWLER